MKRHNFISAICGALACLTMAGFTQAAERRPNVLFLMSDEHTFSLLGAAGNPLIKTPNLDRLAREGARFENCIVTTPFCSPSRASIMTGLYPHHHLVENNVNQNTIEFSLDPQRTPATENILFEQGYKTLHWGKIHLFGDNTRSKPYILQPWHCNSSLKCYENWPAFFESYRAQYEPERMKKLEELGLVAPFDFNPKNVNHSADIYGKPEMRAVKQMGRLNMPVDIKREQYFGRELMLAMEKLGDDPWMLTCSYHPPHEPLFVPEPYYSMYDRDAIPLPDNQDAITQDNDKDSRARRDGQKIGEAGIREFMALNYGFVTMIDDYIGEILAKLDELGLAEDTLVIFTSDHGDMVGGHGCVGKRIMGQYDELLRVPLLMRYPGKIKAGTVISKPVSCIDLQPTILDYTGQPAPQNIDGISLRPLINNPDLPAWRDYTVSERGWEGFVNQRVFRTLEWKYEWCNDPRWKNKLFHLSNDPLEKRDLFDHPEYEGMVRELHARLGKFMEETGDYALKTYSPDPFDTSKKKVYKATINKVKQD
ncbi:sulfatase-like hydrolase/transferase [Pontiellaceae bacterium B12227]|nr:sulfatase-like hydrolase/transferase [Pontiellaceae bacterium B12227]